ncbi:unnamed protein product [Aphanomyces euteiches]
MGLCCSGHDLVREKAFVLEGSVGQGTHSRVFRAKYKATGEDVAIKMIVKSAAKAAWPREIAVMKMLEPHPNVIELKGTYETVSKEPHAHLISEYVCVVMEYAMGGELFQLLIRDGAYSEEVARRFMRDILAALVHLHKQNVVHGDLKPENLLVTSKHASKANVKLADFSMAAVLTSQRLVEKDSLTWAYCPPEVLQAPATATALDPKIDMWSVGVILYILLSGRHPFDPDGRCSKEIMIDWILQFQMVDLHAGWEDVSSEAKDVIRQLLCRDPAKRLTAEEALRHPWFTQTTVPTLPLQSSLRGDLNIYVRSMTSRFRTTVVVAIAARRFSSLHKKPEDIQRIQREMKLAEDSTLHTVDQAPPQGSKPPSSDSTFTEAVLDPASITVDGPPPPP